MNSIRNIFTTPLYRKADSDLIKSQNLGIDNVFQAEYNYGPKEEQINKLNYNYLLYSKFNNPYNRIPHFLGCILDKK